MAATNPAMSAEKVALFAAVAMHKLSWQQVAFAQRDKSKKSQRFADSTRQLRPANSKFLYYFYWQ